MMNNSLFRLTAGIGVGAGVALYCAMRVHRRNQSVLVRTRRQTDAFMKSVEDLKEAASDFLDRSRDEAARQKKGIQQALEAGSRAYRSATS
jgi:hypothetical protein